MLNSCEHVILLICSNSCFLIEVKFDIESLELILVNVYRRGVCSAYCLERIRRNRIRSLLGINAVSIRIQLSVLIKRTEQTSARNILGLIVLDLFAFG